MSDRVEDKVSEARQRVIELTYAMSELPPPYTREEAGLDALIAAVEERTRREAAVWREALELLRDNPEWVCTCIQRPQHDPRCAVEIASAALAQQPSGGEEGTDG